MRYQKVLLPALASLVFASDDTTASSDQAPDALPVEDLRDIPVPTYTVAAGTSQDIPYATEVAIAQVSSQVAATPLSVFPAATDVPINAAGTSGSSDDGANSNVIVSGGSTTGSKVKRGLDDPCSPQPTIDNFYKVDVSSPAAFNADANIATAATGAKTPAGYYQNFKNLAAANSAMNYLGYTVVNTGTYDVDFCAKTCDAKSGCLSFNIYFERDPTINPADTCSNPQAFANIKCSFWGTGLDTTTANNVGQWRNKFWVSIAGSNAYTSYRLGGPVDGWNGPQDLGKKALNAPLWDCTNTWTYLGYKLLQTGSIDPNLCAAACDAQTAYNKAHPAGVNAVPCNAFGSYILNKKNSTGSYQQGQMCTFYTAYWDAKYATNSGASDPSIGATYSYTYSAFYGKKGTQPQCGSDFTSSSGTYIKGGDAQQGQTNEAKRDITANSLQPFCSSLLSYTTPTATTTVYSTDISSAITTVTVTQYQKREASETPSVISVNTADYPDHLLPTEFFANATATATVAKRDAVSTPGVLARYPATILSSACSQAVPSPTNTATTTTLVTLSTTVSSTVTATTAPTCAATPTTIAHNRCSCTYAGACGKFVVASGGSCGYNAGPRNSYQECANQCDWYTDCYAFNYGGENSKSCMMCDSGRGTIDSTAQGTVYKRTSCPSSPGCYA